MRRLFNIYNYYICDKKEYLKEIPNKYSVNDPYNKTIDKCNIKFKKCSLENQLNINVVKAFLIMTILLIILLSLFKNLY